MFAPASAIPSTITSCLFWTAGMSITSISDRKVWTVTVLRHLIGRCMRRFSCIPRVGCVIGVPLTPATERGNPQLGLWV